MLCACRQVLFTCNISFCWFPCVYAGESYRFRWIEIFKYNTSIIMAAVRYTQPHDAIEYMKQMYTKDWRRHADTSSLVFLFDEFCYTAGLRLYKLELAIEERKLFANHIISLNEQQGKLPLRLNTAMECDVWLQSLRTSHQSCCCCWMMALKCSSSVTSQRNDLLVVMGVYTRYVPPFRCAPLPINCHRLAIGQSTNCSV